MNDPLVGKTIGGCEILEVIGQGGMATVYRAHQLSIDRYVAIKVLPPEFMRQSVSLDRFKREATIVARLAHRAIVPIHDHGEHEGMPYMVMRLMDGGSVEDMLATGPISPDRTLAIVEQIAPALDFAHREGVLHRDLKPSNILLDANGDAYITDFGIARILGPDTRALTTTGVVGTPSYMSPEQAQGHELDGRSDIYALGVVMFEMLTGVRPFEGDTPYTVAVKHVTEPVPSACAINPKLSPAIEQVLYKALAKKREQRFSTANEMVTALREALLIAPDAEAAPLVETEPSLHESLRAEAARLASGLSAANGPMMARPTPPEIQFVMPYVSQGSPDYSGALRRPISHSQPRFKRSVLPSWLTWAMIAALVGAILVAGTIGGMYMLINSGDSGGQDPGIVTTRDFGATAVFKLTATRQAIDTAIASPLATTLSLTAPPTNTLTSLTTPEPTGD